MGRYLIERLLSLPLVLLGISVVTFALMSLAPGDPALLVLRQGGGEPSPGIRPPGKPAVRRRIAGNARPPR